MWYSNINLRGEVMKKLVMFFTVGLLSLTLLAACGNDGEKTTTEENTNTEADGTETEEVTDEEVEVEEEDDGEAADAQLDLRLGDTALVESTIGTYELTVHSAEIVGTELDGEEALLDELILLEMTFKNIDDKPLIAEDLMINFGIRTDLESSDNTNAAASFDSIEYFEGEILPDEEREAQFIADTKTADEYYFKTGTGVVAAGTHNDVMWTITDEEARK